jgi:hypothetical protein
MFAKGAGQRPTPHRIVDQTFGLVCPIFSQGSHAAEFSVRNEQFSQDPKNG